ncbi:1,4-dihydroxy-6-naphthoate synthase [Paenibacillus albicereus]|uniref:1,4-dihydroxy-6-naphtoate synthase n=1 Tax=Paenibacillus albicereus TaxID=2726185 RepID=A0A6H2H3I0_9BACL|nr:1,4-dihydroxy-6-naphthoate synthase [Paenibacillus albicereus]QJC54149.1 1,4-dihydroxy-6-naphthoate synthase [Paenibacillus albicereus]
MKIAYSPCPNDTFVFHAWAHGRIDGAPVLDVTYADIDVTNGWAARGEGPEVMKISYAALPYVLDRYALIPCGGALGRGCGPLVLTAGGGRIEAEAAGHSTATADGDAAASVSDAGASAAQRMERLACANAGERIQPLDPPAGASAAGAAHAHAGAAAPGMDPSWLSGRTVAVPSDRSTAYLLFRLWTAQQIGGEPPRIVVLPFHEIMPAVRDGRVDAGLVIHEARFTYPDYGLTLMADMGTWWEADTGLPIPLGAIIARRGLDVESLARWTRASVEYAWSHPDESAEYVREHAQEMSPDVARSHIALYVNEFTRSLGEDGLAAVQSLLGRAAREGLVPEFDPALLRS